RTADECQSCSRSKNGASENGIRTSHARETWGHGRYSTLSTELRKEPPEETAGADSNLRCDKLLVEEVGVEKPLLIREVQARHEPLVLLKHPIEPRLHIFVGCRVDVLRIWGLEPCRDGDRDDLLFHDSTVHLWKNGSNVCYPPM